MTARPGRFTPGKETEYPLYSGLGGPLFVLCSWFRASLIKLLIIVQRDATLSGLFIILQVHSTCFGC